MKEKFNQELEDTEQKEAEEAVKGNGKNQVKQEETTKEKNEPSQSMQGGSSEIYLALVKNSTATYQTKMQNATPKMVDQQHETLDETRLTNSYLSYLSTLVNSKITSLFWLD